MATAAMPAEDMALDLMLRDPSRFGRVVISDQIAVRRIRLSRFGADSDRAAELRVEINKLAAVLPAS